MVANIPDPTLQSRVGGNQTRSFFERKKSRERMVYDDPCTFLSAVSMYAVALSPVSMYAGRGSDKNRSYINAQQCFHFRGSRLRIAVAGCGICGTLFLIRSPIFSATR